MSRALIELQTELGDEIDGGEECRGHDQKITRWIELVEQAQQELINAARDVASMRIQRDELADALRLGLSTGQIVGDSKIAARAALAKIQVPA